VWVTTSVHPKRAVFTVENTGEQLTPQVVATLAEPFVRGTERIRTDHAGVGLGLAIVKRITQAHDGTLTLTPRAAGGLCVRGHLPTAPPPPPPGPRGGPGPRANSPPHHRTLADDDQGSCRTASELCDVHVHQHCPTAAPSGVDADRQAVSDEACIAPPRPPS